MQNADGHAGYKWLSEEYDVVPVQPFRVRSVIGSARSSAASNGFTIETYPAHYQPDATLGTALTTPQTMMTSRRFCVYTIPCSGLERPRRQAAESRTSRRTWTWIIQATQLASL